MPCETTIAVLKPDGVARHLEAPILSLFEKNGIELLARVEKQPARAFVLDHLHYIPDYEEKIGAKILGLFDAKKMDRSRTMYAGLSAYETGVTMRELLVDYISSGVNYAYLLKGDDAIMRVKQLCGATFPADADKNTIRGRYSHDSFEICVQEKRSPYNIMHAADSSREANHQIALWFPHYVLGK